MIREKPRAGGRIVFELEDRTATGTVERIVPDSWQPASELIPTVHVLRDTEPGAAKKAPPEWG
jgi:hypothetical protein